VIVQLARLEGATLPPVPGVASLPSRPTGSAGASAVPALSEQAAKPDASLPAPFSLFAPGGGGMSLFVTLITVLAALIGLVALARLTLGEDLFSPAHWLR
jgi:hypothetical protein